MRTFKMSLAIASLFALSACAGMTTTERNTLGGAAIGGAAGAALTGGSALGTLGGAAVGGIIGHEVGEEKERRRY
jgi:osmotically inducible lipoprotein OsmB